LSYDQTVKLLVISNVRITKIHIH